MLGKIYRLILCVLLLIAAVLYVFGDIVTYNQDLLSLLVIFAVCLSALFLFSRNKKEFFSPIIIFILSYLIVFFQLDIDLLFGNVSLGYRFLWDSSSIISSAIISLSGLIALFLGYSVYNPKVNITRVKNERIYPKNAMVYLSLFFLGIFILTTDMSFFLGGYSQEALEGQSGTMSAYSQLLFKSCMMAVIILNASNNRIKTVFNNISGYLSSYSLVFYIILLTYFLLIMLSGDRGPIIYMTMVYVFGYYYGAKKKMALKTLIVGAVCAASFVTFLGIVRSMDNKLSAVERFRAASTSNIENASFSPSTAELSSSVVTLHASVSEVPNNRPYFYGTFQFNSLVATIPFAGKVTRLFMSTKWEEATSSGFLTHLINGPNYASGTGTSVIADFYLDFGYIGVIIGMFIFGCFFKNMDFYIFHSKQSASLWMLCLIFTTFSLAIYIPRSYALIIIQQGFVLYVILSAYQAVIRKRI